MTVACCGAQQRVTPLPGLNKKHDVPLWQARRGACCGPAGLGGWNNLQCHSKCATYFGNRLKFATGFSHEAHAQASAALMVTLCRDANNLQLRTVRGACIIELAARVTLQTLMGRTYLGGRSMASVTLSLCCTQA